MAKWMIANKKADFDGLAGKFGIRNVTARLIANRLITSRETESIECNDETVNAYLNADLDFLHNPKLMADMEKGAEVMLGRIKDGAKIRVIGDYDVDGICSSFILISNNYLSKQLSVTNLPFVRDIFIHVFNYQIPSLGLILTYYNILSYKYPFDS